MNHIITLLPEKKLKEAKQADLMKQWEELMKISPVRTDPDPNGLLWPNSESQKILGPGYPDTWKQPYTIGDPDMFKVDVNSLPNYRVGYSVMQDSSAVEQPITCKSNSYEIKAGSAFLCGTTANKEPCTTTDCANADYITHKLL